ncbi:hypothetical protein OTC26_021210 [Streptomyces tirandamycinicus]|uniref:hypothetical protein n=1 Tax=Streptomyces tirandamycinicus TaxID=2174846 RepID=UPI00226E45CF|nr:hypothetical protein [Streptomyces tirandamycinicus]MCY0980404.1 hypothetical protein [Streptomyces tirandamycinicus]
MAFRRVNAAKFIRRGLDEPYETLLGGEDPEATHHLLATVHADICCPPSGHSISWQDCYDGAQMRPLPHKANFLLDNRGEPDQLPPHLVGTALRRARAAQRIAVRIRREARHMLLDNG